jgi:hypothetical protein
MDGRDGDLRRPLGENVSAGGPGDNPIEDLLKWGLHPFPSDIEALILKLNDVSPHYINQLNADCPYFSWSRGEDLESGRRYLTDLLAEAQADLDRLLNLKRDYLNVEKGPAEWKGARTQLRHPNYTAYTMILRLHLSPWPRWVARRAAKFKR